MANVTLDIAEYADVALESVGCGRCGTGDVDVALVMCSCSWFGIGVGVYICWS